MTQRFLTVQLADIGDLVLITPALQALRQTHPQAHIALLTTTHSAAIVPDNLVDDVIVIDRQTSNSSFAFLRLKNLRLLWQLRKHQFDTVLYFHHFTLRLGTIKFALIAMLGGIRNRVGLDNGKGWFLTKRIPDMGFGGKHQAQYWLDLVASLDSEVSSPIPSTQVQSAPFDLPPKTRTRIVIHAGSGGYSRARRWEPQKFAALADRLVTALSAEIVLVGSHGDDSQQVLEIMQQPAIDCIDKTTIPQLASVIESADVFIGADSGVMHVASATNTPIVAIFGPSNHEAWSPWVIHNTVDVIHSNAECSPCSYVGHGIGLRDGCEARTCLKMISVDQVYDGVDRLLTGSTDIPQEESLNEIRSLHSQVQILDIPVDAVTYDDWMALVAEWVNQGKRCYHVCTTNPEFLMIAQQDVNFRNILQRADLRIADGVGLLWAAKRQGVTLPQRVTGSDGIYVICEQASKLGWKLFFLGASEGIAEQAAERLRVQYPKLQVVGTYAGSPSADEEDEIVERINRSGADILLVAYGAPKQDKWIARNLPRLQTKMAMGVGGTFDFVVGKVPRAPQWMRRMGVEWLYRLIRQPWRIMRMTRLPRFVLAVLFSNNRK